MKPNRLFIIPVVTFIAFIVVAAIAFQAKITIEKEQENNIQLREIAVQLSHRNQLRTEYLIYPEERIKTQWFITHNAVGKLNETVPLQNEMLVQRFYNEHEAVGSMFSSIIQLTESQSTNTELQNRLLSQLLIRSDEQLTILEALQAESDQHVQQTVRRSIIGVASVIFLSLVAVMLTTYLVFRSAERKAKEVERLKAQFFSMTSHELRGPLIPMRAQLQMIQQDYYGPLNKKQKGAVDIVLRNTIWLDGIIVDLLEVSRLQAATIKIDYEKSTLVEETKRLVEEMNSFLPEKGIQIKLVLEELPEIETDPHRVMQVLRNLLSNAKKFSSEKSIVSVVVTADSEKINFSVRGDSSIKPEEQHRVFQPFYQSEESRRYQGTGLGLVISKGIVEVLGGTIGFTSTLQQGTTFTFSIPRTRKKNE